MDGRAIIRSYAVKTPQNMASPCLVGNGTDKRITDNRYFYYRGVKQLFAVYKSRVMFDTYVQI